MCGHHPCGESRWGTLRPKPPRRLEPRRKPQAQHAARQLQGAQLQVGVSLPFSSISSLFSREISSVSTGWPKVPRKGMVDTGTQGRPDITCH